MTQSSRACAAYVALIHGVKWFLWLCAQDRVCWIGSLFIERFAMLSSLLQHPLECKSYSKSCKSGFYYKALLSRHAKNVAFSDGMFQGWLQSKGHCWKVRAKGFWLAVSCDCPCMCREFTRLQLPLPSSEVCTTDQCGKATTWDNMNHQDELVARSLCSRSPVMFISNAVNPGPNLKWQGN